MTTTPPDSSSPEWWAPFSDQGVLQHFEAALDDHGPLDGAYRDIVAEIERRADDRTLTVTLWVAEQRELRDDAITAVWSR